MVVCGSLISAMNARTFGTEGGEHTLVLAHGYGTDQSIWDKLVPSLAKKHRVVVFDWNFTGKTVAVSPRRCVFDPVKNSSFEAYANDLVDLMNEMDLKSCVFVGHSMSGMIGCIASVKRPELFKHLFLVGASPGYMNLEDYEGGFNKPEIDQLLSAIEVDFYGWASAFASVAVGGKDPASAEKFKSCLRMMKPEVALAVAKMIFLGDQRAVLEKVVTPSTIIQTTNDYAVPASVPLYMQQKMKGKSWVEIIDTDGHFPQLTASQELLDVINKTLAS